MADTSDAVTKDFVATPRKSTAPTKKATIATATWQSSSDSDSGQEDFIEEQLCATNFRPYNKFRRPWTSSKPRPYTSRVPNRHTYTNLLEMIHPLIDKAIARKRMHAEAMDEDPSKDTTMEQNNNLTILETPIPQPMEMDEAADFGRRSLKA